MLGSGGTGAVYLAIQMRPLMPGSRFSILCVPVMVVGFDGVMKERITETVNSVRRSTYLDGGDICNMCSSATLANSGSLETSCTSSFARSASMAKGLGFSLLDIDQESREVG